MTAARYIFFTDNVERMVSFYRDVMKMTVLMPPEATDHDPEGWVRLVSGGVEVAIHRAGKPGCAGRNRNKLVFIVKDVGETREELRKAGVRIGKHTSSRSLNAATSRIQTETRCRFRIGDVADRFNLDKRGESRGCQ